MMTATITPYSEKLKNPLWQKRRLDILTRDNWTCADCQSGLNDGKTLHVHHIKYVFGRDPWDYPDDNFETLCEDCHADRHKEVKPEPLIGISEESDSLNAAFAILYVDLNKEITRLIKDDVDILHQVNFISEYENVQVENYLVLESTNDPNATALYLKALKFATRFNLRLPSLEQFTYNRYFDMRTTLIKRVLQEMITNSMNALKNPHTPTEQTAIQVWVQKINRLRTKFFQSIKTV